MHEKQTDRDRLTKTICFLQQCISFFVRSPSLVTTLSK